MLDNDFNNMNDVVDGAYDREIYVEIFSITVITVIKSLSVKLRQLNYLGTMLP